MKQIFSIIWQYIRKMDKLLLLATTALGVLGIVTLYSIVNCGVNSYENFSSSLYKGQLQYLIIGIIAAMVISAFDYNWFTKLWFIYAPVCLILVFLTFTSLGYGVDGADDKAWIKLGPVSLQPSEFLKVAFILTFALHLSKVGDKINKPLNVIMLCIHGIIPFLLIAAQGDHGTALIFLFIFIIMLFSAGISVKYIIAALVLVPPALILAWFKILQPHHRLRIQILFDPSLDADIAYQQNHGKIALGSGQLFGKGLLGGEYHNVPEIETDFIFAHIGQTLGFVGCLGVVAVFFFVCLKIISDSRVSKDPLGRNICIGVFGMLFIHCFLNIGMVLGVMPVIGVPLPFISRGGASLLSMYIAIGIVMSVYSHSEKKYHVFFDSN